LPAAGAAGAQTLQGNLYSLSVWAVALQPAQVESNMTSVPDPSTSGLAAYYDLAQEPGFNTVTGAPLALLAGATIDDAPDPTLPVVADAVNPRAAHAGPAPDEEEAAILGRLRASVDRVAAASGVIAHLEHMRAILPLEGSGRLPRGVLRRGHAEIEALLATARRDPFDLPAGILVRHEHEGEVFLVHHFSAHSVILARYAAGSPDCSQLLGAVIVSGVMLLLNVLFGVAGAALRNVRNTILALVSRAGPATLAVVQTAFQHLVASVTSLATWTNLIRVLFAEGFMSAAFGAVLAAAGWMLAVVLVGRFAGFVASGPVQVVLFLVRLGINVYNVIEAWIAYTQQCPGSTNAAPAGGPVPA
jgi:hypothetical protein